jgi:hypothetical protein
MGKIARAIDCCLTASPLDTVFIGRRKRRCKIDAVQLLSARRLRGPSSTMDALAPEQVNLEKLCNAKTTSSTTDGIGKRSAGTGALLHCSMSLPEA